MGEGNISCSLREYESNLKSRLQIASLNTSDIYTFYAKLAESRVKAGRLIAKIISLELADAAPQVSLTLLDDDFRPRSGKQAYGTIVDGIWTPDASITLKMSEPAGGRAKEGYFVAHDDGMPSDFDQMLAQLDQKELAMFNR